jgi:hypothetical protein
MSIYYVFIYLVETHLHIYFVLIQVFFTEPMGQTVKLLNRIWELTISILGRKPAILAKIFVAADKSLDSVLNSATTTSFHILSNWLFTVIHIYDAIRSNL